jgi:lipopolysaccharide export system permease protein
MLATDDASRREATAAQRHAVLSLPEMTARTAEAGLDATGYRPCQFLRDFVLVAMVLVAAFSLRFFRFGGSRTFRGVAAGFVLYIVTKVLSDLGGAGMISPVVAAWSPALVGSMLGTVILLYSEDG